MKDSYFVRAIHAYFRIRPEMFIFWTILIFYLILWFANPGNKLVTGSFFVLFGILYSRFKSLPQSLLFTYLASLIVLTGKTYLFELISPRFYLSELFPFGHTTSLTVTTSMVLAAIMSLLIIRDYSIGTFKGIKYRLHEFFLIAFFLWKLFSDLIGSQRPDISLIYGAIGLQPLVLFLYLKNYSKFLVKIVPLLVSVFAAQILFESFVVFQQYLNGSPIYKTIEMQESTFNFGTFFDEMKFRFRPAGTLIHANQLAAWLSFWLSLIFVYLYKKGNVFVFTVLIIGLVSMILTLSRSGWIGVAISLMTCLFVLEKVKKKSTPSVIKKHAVSLSIIALVLFVYFLLPRAEKSLYSFNDGGGLYRREQIKEALLLISQYPVFGVGSAYSIPAGLSLNPRGYFSQNANSIHNYYFTLASEHGLPALIFFVLFLIIFLKYNMSLIWKNKIETEKEYIRLGLISGSLSLLFIYVFQPYESITFLVLACGILELSNNEKNKREI